MDENDTNYNTTITTTTSIDEESIAAISPYNKGTAPLRIWELDENSTRYDHLLASSSDEQLSIYWLTWAIVALLAGIIIVTVFLGIVTNQRARSHSFNIYVIYLMIPDFCFSLLCGTTCLLNYLKGSYFAHWMCSFQSWYCVWGIGSNTWINAIITYQLHKLLVCSNRRERYKIPTLGTARNHALMVYAYTALLGCLGLFRQTPTSNTLDGYYDQLENQIIGDYDEADAINYDPMNNDTSGDDGQDGRLFPFYSAPPSGLACIPVEIDQRTSYFFWFVFFPLFAGIPVVYVVWVCFDIWYKKLLPPSGKRRLLVIYFGRVIMVFLVVWVPYFLLLFVLSTWVPHYGHFIGGTLTHLQGVVSAGVSLLKPDIYYAVKSFVTCYGRWDCRCCTSCCRRTNTSNSNDSNRDDSDGDEVQQSEFSAMFDMLDIRAGMELSSRFYRQRSTSVFFSTDTPFKGNSNDTMVEGDSSEHVAAATANTLNAIQPSQLFSLAEGCSCSEEDDEDSETGNDHKDGSLPATRFNDSMPYPSSASSTSSSVLMRLGFGSTSSNHRRGGGPRSWSASSHVSSTSSTRSPRSRSSRQSSSVARSNQSLWPANDGSYCTDSEDDEDGCEDCQIGECIAEEQNIDGFAINNNDNHSSSEETNDQPNPPVVDDTNLNNIEYLTVGNNIAREEHIQQVDEELDM